MYFSHGLHHCIFNIQVLSHSGESESRTPPTAIQRTWLDTNCWQYSLNSLCYELSSRWSCSIHPLQTQGVSHGHAYVFKAHDCIFWGTGLAHLLRVTVYFICMCHFCRPSLFYVFGLMQICNCCNAVTQNAIGPEPHSKLCTLFG